MEVVQFWQAINCRWERRVIRPSRIFLSKLLQALDQQSSQHDCWGYRRRWWYHRRRASNVLPWQSVSFCLYGRYTGTRTSYFRYHRRILFKSHWGKSSHWGRNGFCTSVYGLCEFGGACRVYVYRIIPKSPASWRKRGVSCLFDPRNRRGFGNHWNAARILSAPNYP